MRQRLTSASLGPGSVGAKAPSATERCPPAWFFPVPVRPSRFVAGDPAFAQFNVEAAQDRIPAFAFAKAAGQEVLHYDLQTQLLGNARGRHGSGRSGVYRGRYLKGVGRTPAAANWDDASDIYHASGHLSVGSAIRERLITAFLEARGLGETIVPCEAVLLARLTPAEARAVRREESSSRAHFVASDADLMALTVKPADFARMSNFVFALDHFTGYPQHLGELFLELERQLHPLGERAGLEGSPERIGRALERAFRRGLANFQAYARAGLFWSYLNSNFSLDGRFLDLETPLYFGAPFVGLAVSEPGGVLRRDLLGFEEFGFIQHWRLFLKWLKSRLRWLAEPEVDGLQEARPFLRELSRELAARFPRGHLLFNDEELTARATANLAGPLGLGRRDRASLHELARHEFGWRLYGSERPVPDHAWRPLVAGSAPAPMTPFPRRFEAAGFIAPRLSKDGQAFAAALSQLGSLRDSHELLRALADPARFVPGA